MLANDFQHRTVGEALFVVTEFCRNIDAGENRRLPGSTLRPAFNSKTGVSRNNNPVKRGFRNLVAKYRQWFRVGKAVKRIERPTCTNPEAVNEEQQD